MISVSLGPIALPVAPVLLLLAVWGASWAASRIASKRSDQGHAAAAGNAIFNAAMLGLLTARLAHLMLHSDLYLDSPWSAFDIRDGGWHAPTGAVCGAAWLAWRGWRMPALRRPLAGGVLAGAVFWIAASLATGFNDEPGLPALMLTEADSGAVVSLPQVAHGRPVVVNLWASWCGPCRQEMPLLAAAQRRETTVGFVFVNQGESAAAVRAYLTDQGLPLREVLLDSESRLGRAVGSTGLPTTLFYDAKGRRIDAHFGVLNAAALESRLRLLRTDR
jgi:thiol-disulfide isomerase/thioredoxin